MPSHTGPTRRRPRESHGDVKLRGQRGQGRAVKCESGGVTEHLPVLHHREVGTSKVPHRREVEIDRGHPVIGMLDVIAPQSLPGHPVIARRGRPDRMATQFVWQR